MPFELDFCPISGRCSLQYDIRNGLLNSTHNFQFLAALDDFIPFHLELRRMQISEFLGLIRTRIKLVERIFTIQRWKVVKRKNKVKIAVNNRLPTQHIFWWMIWIHMQTQPFGDSSARNLCGWLVQFKSFYTPMSCTLIMCFGCWLPTTQPMVHVH